MDAPVRSPLTSTMSLSLGTASTSFQPLLRLLHCSSLKSVMDKLIACALTIGLLMVLAAPAAAQRTPIVVDGNLWLKSSAEARKAFLVGAGSMTTMEGAYAKRKGTPPPMAGAIASEALDHMTLDEISSRITRWYEANPGRHNMPALGVLWIDMVAPATAKK